MTVRRIVTRWQGHDWPLADIARVTGIQLGTLRMRYAAGKRGDALTAPVRKLVNPPRIEQVAKGLL